MPVGRVTFKPRHVSLAMALAGAREKRCFRVGGHHASPPLDLRSCLGGIGANAGARVNGQPLLSGHQWPHHSRSPKLA